MHNVFKNQYSNIQFMASVILVYVNFKAMVTYTFAPGDLHQISPHRIHKLLYRGSYKMTTESNLLCSTVVSRISGHFIDGSVPASFPRQTTAIKPLFAIEKWTVRTEGVFSEFLSTSS